MLNEAVKVAYNRGRYELGKEILDKCSIAETISVARLRAMLHEIEEAEPNDQDIDRMVDVPHYVIARANKAFSPIPLRAGSQLRSVPGRGLDGA